MKLSESTVKLSEAAKVVIDLATKIRDYWNTELPKRLRDYPIIAPDEDRGPPPPEEVQLREYLTELPPELLNQLLLVMHLGRGEFATEKLAEQYERLKDSFAKDERALRYFTAKAEGSLADELCNGIEKLNGNKIKVEKLFAKNTKIRK